MRGLDLNGAIPIGMPQQMPVMQVIYNDTQLMALLAATVYKESMTAAESVGIAADIMVEAIKQNPKFGQRVQALQRSVST